MVRDQEVGGSNPLAPTTFNRISELQHRKSSKSAWRKTRRSVVRRDLVISLKFNNVMLFLRKYGFVFWLRKLRMIRQIELPERFPLTSSS